MSLEGCEVEKDIGAFIREKGTGQEIPDPPKYINFCRGDLNDTASEASDDDNYSVAQFQRTINPAFRSSSPQPSTYESHHDPQSHLAMQMSQKDPHTPPSRETTMTPQKLAQSATRPTLLNYRQQPAQLAYQDGQFGDLAPVPHNEYPTDGMTMYCRTEPPSERSSAASPQRPSSRDSHSEYSNPTSFSSFEPTSGKQSPTKIANGAMVPTVGEERQVQKKKSGFFQHHSPFRRKSKHDRDTQSQQPQSLILPPPGSRSTWGSSSGRGHESSSGSPTRQSKADTTGNQAAVFGGGRSASPEPVDPRANFQLNVGNNVFDVASPDNQVASMSKSGQDRAEAELDPIAQALAELKGVTKNSSVRMSADRYHGLATPAPPGTPGVGVPRPMANGNTLAAQRGTPPPSYEQPIKRLDLPQPAFTSAQMQQTTRKYTDQTQNIFTGTQSRPGTRGSGQGQEVVRAKSPAPSRSTSPMPVMYSDQRQTQRSASPNPYASNGSARQRPASSSPVKRVSDHGYGSTRGDPRGDRHRPVSPSPAYMSQERPGSSGGAGMQLQLTHGSSEGSYGGNQGSRRPHGSGRPMSQYAGGRSEGGYDMSVVERQENQGSRVRSKSVADGRQFTRDGRPILHYGQSRPSECSKIMVLMFSVYSSRYVYVPGSYSGGA